MDNRDEFGEYTWTLAEHASTFKAAELSSAARERIKLLILDGIGCGIFGAQLPWSRLLLDVLKSMDGYGQAHVWCSDGGFSPDHAALLNGSYIQSFELDDYNPRAGLHSCASVLPAVFSAADCRGPIAGEEFLSAVVVGFDVGLRVGQCMGVPRTLERGWHTGALFGTFAAAGACARVLGLDPVRMSECLGIAGTQASGLMAAQFQSMVKRMHHGRAAQSGVYAAFLAEAGYTGIHRIFEQEYGGFCSTILGGVQAGYDLSRLTINLGDHAGIFDISIKPYACNGGIHTAIDAIKEILARHPLRGEDILHISVKTTAANAHHVGWPYEPRTLTTAQMNMGFAIAAVIELGDAFIEQYTEDTICDPRLVNLAKRVDVVADAEIGQLPPSESQTVEVTVSLVGGGKEHTRTTHARGSASRPLDAEDIIEKYNRLADPVLGHDRTAKVLDLTLNLDSLADVSELSELLRQSNR